MKRTLIPLLLCGLILLSGCGETTTPVSVSSAPAEAFGASTLEAVPVQEAETTTLPEGSVVPETGVQTPQASTPDTDSENATEPSPVNINHDYIDKAVTAAIICDSMDMLPYTPEDSMYLWRAVGYLAGQIGTDGTLVTQSGDHGNITETAALWLAYAMDADFSGELPSVTEEDPLISHEDNGSYLINMLAQGALTLNMTNTRDTAEGDVFTEEAELLRDGESLGTYTVTLVKYTGPMEGGHHFGYSIQDISSK